jgi:hypothetical protein
MRWIPLVVALLCIWVIPAAAVQPDEILSDSQLEARARTLTKETSLGLHTRSSGMRVGKGIGQRAACTPPMSPRFVVVFTHTGTVPRAIDKR